MIDDLKPYPTYKDSGVPWLGRIPEHWSMTRLKHVCRFAYGDSLPEERRVAGNVAVFGSNGRVGYNTAANTLSPCIIIGRKGSFGKVNYSAEPVFAIDTTFYVDARVSHAYLRWLYYALSWLRLDGISKDSAVPGLDRDDAYQRPIPFPADHHEQVAIARFLDHVDRRVRRYIRAKQKLIKLLEEQKRAVINRTVKRGLDPNVRLKHSGVEWLGYIPEHWFVTRLKFVAAEIIDCLHATPVYTENGAYPAIRTADVLPGQILLNGARRVDEQTYRKWTARMAPAAGDVLYTREGERFGIAALVPDDVKLCISQRMMAFRIHSQYSSGYIMWQLNCAHVYAQAAADLIGAAAPHVNVERIRNLWLTIPPRDEQDEIMSVIQGASERLSVAIRRAHDEIRLLREYRKSLIADVVTGKLDVRALIARIPDELEEPEALRSADECVQIAGFLDDDVDSVPEAVVA